MDNKVKTKILDYEGLQKLVAQIKSFFAPLSHDHTKEEITDFEHEHSAATDTENGFMAAEDKQVLYTRTQVKIITWEDSD